MRLEKRKGIPSSKGYYTAKSGVTFRYDSMSELAMMMHLDEIGADWIKNTKLRIPYLFEGKERNYIPDFIIDSITISEIKGSNDKPELPFKVKAAIEYCKKHGLVYELITYDKVKSFIDWNLVREYHNNYGKKITCNTRT